MAARPSKSQAVATSSELPTSSASSSACTRTPVICTIESRTITRSAITSVSRSAVQRSMRSSR